MERYAKDEQRRHQKNRMWTRALDTARIPKRIRRLARASGESLFNVKRALSLKARAEISRASRIVVCKSRRVVVAMSVV